MNAACRLFPLWQITQKHAVIAFIRKPFINMRLLPKILCILRSPVHKFSMHFMLTEKRKCIVLCGQPNQFHVNVEKRRRKFTTNIASTTRACHRHPHIHHLCILPLLLLWLYRFGCLPSQPAHISGKHLMSLLAFQTCLSRCQNAMTISSMTCDVCST